MGQAYWSLSRLRIHQREISRLIYLCWSLAPCLLFLAGRDNSTCWCSHSSLTLFLYFIIFLGISPHWKHIFIMQKRTVRIMLGCRRLVSCRNLFRKLKILALSSQYVFSITMFIVKNKHQFTVNSEIRSINTRQHLNLHQPAPNLTGFKQGIYYSGVKIYNHLPLHIKQLSDNPRLFELKLKNFLHFHSFYSLEEYFQYNLTCWTWSYKNGKKKE